MRSLIRVYFSVPNMSYRICLFRSIYLVWDVVWNLMQTLFRHTLYRTYLLPHNDGHLSTACSTVSKHLANLLCLL